MKSDLERLEEAFRAVKTDPEIEEIDKRIREMSNYSLSNEVLIELLELRGHRVDQILGFYNFKRR